MSQGFQILWVFFEMGLELGGVEDFNLNFLDASFANTRLGDGSHSVFTAIPKIFHRGLFHGEWFHQSCATPVLHHGLKLDFLQTRQQCEGYDVIKGRNRGGLPIPIAPARAVRPIR